MFIFKQIFCVFQIQVYINWCSIAQSIHSTYYWLWIFVTVCVSLSLSLSLSCDTQWKIKITHIFVHFMSIEGILETDQNFQSNATMVKRKGNSISRRTYRATTRILLLFIKKTCQSIFEFKLIVSRNHSLRHIRNALNTMGSVHS